MRFASFGLSLYYAEYAYVEKFYTLFHKLVRQCVENPVYPGAKLNFALLWIAFVHRQAPRRIPRPRLSTDDIIKLESAAQNGMFDILGRYKCPYAA